MSLYTEFATRWIGPNVQNIADHDWKPLPQDFPDWAPLAEKWQPIDGLTEMRNRASIKPLADECVKRLAYNWANQIENNGHDNPIGSNQHFHCYKISRHRAWKDWRNNPINDGKDTWWCANIRQAFQRYSWTNYNGGTFDQLAVALQSAMRCGNQDLAGAVCLHILDWGGVGIHGRTSRATLEWLEESILHGDLISNLSAATSILIPQSNEAFGKFGRVYPQFPMNSGSTKIFSAVALDLSQGLSNAKQDVIIFDGRVSSALGLMARRFANPGFIPEQFKFPFSPIKNRNPSFRPYAVFPNLHDPRITDGVRAEYARTASRCIQQVFGIYKPSCEFVQVEKALFMIGYNVGTTCNGLARPFP